jgi:hypothetical protein
MRRGQEEFPGLVGLVLSTVSYHFPRRAQNASMACCGASVAYTIARLLIPASIASSIGRLSQRLRAFACCGRFMVIVVIVSSLLTSRYVKLIFPPFLL